MKIEITVGNEHLIAREDGATYRQRNGKDQTKNSLADYVYGIRREYNPETGMGSGPRNWARFQKALTEIQKKDGRSIGEIFSDFNVESYFLN